MSTLHYNTNFALVSVFMFLLGLGMGSVMQNLVLVVQNTVAAKNMGAASAGVTFFRTLGGTVGVSALGALLGNRIPVLLNEGGIREAVGQAMANPDALSPAQSGALQQLGAGSFPDLADLPHAIRIIVESAYGLGIAEQFLVALPMGLIAVVAIAFLPNKPLSRQTAAQKLAQDAERVALDTAEAVGGNDSAEAMTAVGVLEGLSSDGDGAGRRAAGDGRSPRAGGGTEG